MSSPTERWISTWKNDALYSIIAKEIELVKRGDGDPDWDSYDHAYRIMADLHEAGLCVVSEDAATAASDIAKALQRHVAAMKIDAETER
jgi:hypothetical protein